MKQTIKTYRRDKQTQLNVYFAKVPTTQNRVLEIPKIEEKSKSSTAKIVKDFLQAMTDFIECVTIPLKLLYALTFFTGV
jgi:hypothetical protein